jgi:hypothetical protein
MWKIFSMASQSSSRGTETQNIWSLTSGPVYIYIYIYIYTHTHTNCYGVVLKQANKCLYSFKRDELDKEDKLIRELHSAACIVCVLKWMTVSLYVQREWENAKWLQSKWRKYRGKRSLERPRKRRMHNIQVREFIEIWEPTLSVYSLQLFCLTL